MVIANDHYQSIGIVCLSEIIGVQRVARKRSISFKFLERFNSIISLCKNNVVEYELMTTFAVFS